MYYLIQKPWIALKKSKAIRAVRENPDDPYSPWISCNSEHVILESLQMNTINEMLDKSIEIKGNEYPIIGVKTKYENKTSYKWLTYGEINQRINNIAKGYQSIGIEKGEMVLIFAETRLEWILSAFALYKIGSTLVTLIPQLGSEAIVRIVNQAEVKHVVTSEKHMKKFNQIITSIPTIKMIIEMDGEAMNEKHIPFHKLEAMGHESSVNLSKVSQTKKEDIAVIMYTSGSTTDPKGVIITHNQIMTMVRSGLHLFKDEVPNTENHCYISFLPLGHLFEFMAEIMSIGSGWKIAYTSLDTVIEGSAGLSPGDVADIELIKPTIFPAVPLILNRIRKKVIQETERSYIKKKLFNFLMTYKSFWRMKGYKTTICSYFLCGRARRQFGGNLKYILVGGAPLSAETQKISALLLDVVMIHAYGSTEMSAACTATDIYDLRFGGVGAPLAGLRLKLVDWIEAGYSVIDKPNPRGEIAVNGDSITDGYYLMPEETAECYRVENGEKWFYSGDIGEIGKDGCLKIIDRKKDLIKLQNGEYFSLGKIESTLKSCPLIENICIYGKGTYNFLIALIVPDFKSIQSLAKDCGICSEDNEKLCENEVIISHVIKSINSHGLENGLSRREIPLRIKLCSEEWTTDNGFLTASMKLKRMVIINHYKDEVNKLFDDNSDN